jgi:muramidase (phage lysozyme)
MMSLAQLSRTRRGSASWRALMWRAALAALAVGVMLLSVWWTRPAWLLPGTQPLVIQDGEPHIRALMRTISASEANVLRPYRVLHGGDEADSILVHPNRCVGIRTGPNRGNCSTAAGRYQLLHNTWVGLAQRYHPKATKDPDDAAALSFEPLYQDAVVLAWLSDRKAWGMDLGEQLKQGRVRAVLRRLSGTWTSLGYGIESNMMSAELPRVYQQVLAMELERARTVASLLPSANKQTSP